MNSTKQLAEAGIFAAILVIFILGAFYLPLIGSVMLFFLPIPIAILAFRNKISYTFLAGVIAGIISAMIVPFFYSAMMSILALFIGLPLGYLLKRKENPFKVILISGIGAVLAMSILFWGMEFFLGTSFMDQLDLMFSESTAIQSEFANTAAAMGVDISESMEAYTKNTDMLFESIRILIPASILVAGLAFAAGNFLMMHFVMRRLGTPLPPVGSFETFSYPKHLAYGSAGMMVLAYLVGYLGWVDEVVLSMNFTNLFITIFMVQGVSLAYYYLKRQLGKGISIAFIVMFMLTGLSSLISLIGFVDVLMDFRKLRRT